VNDVFLVERPVMARYKDGERRFGRNDVSFMKPRLKRQSPISKLERRFTVAEGLDGAQIGVMGCKSVVLRSRHSSSTMRFRTG
jgi:hypothetical protein